MSVLSALPFSSVVVLVTLSVPSPEVTLNVTAIPSSTERFSSRTSMTNGFARTAPDTPVWLVPETFESPDVIKTVVGVIKYPSDFFFSTKYGNAFAGVIFDKPNSTNLSIDYYKVGSSTILNETIFFPSALKEYSARSVPVRFSKRKSVRVLSVVNFFRCESPLGSIQF